MTTLADQIETARHTSALGISGRVLSCAGLTVQAVGLPVPVGSLCEVRTPAGRVIPLEVIGFRDHAATLMPLDSAAGLTKGMRVRALTHSQKFPVGPGLLGQVVDALGRRFDDGTVAPADTYYPLHRAAPDPVSRPRIDRPLSVGIRSINALLTIGSGQRVGIFAGTGVGKSVLLGMMARHTSADVAVIALVGERGREVGDFLARDLGPEGLKRSVVVVSTSDQSPPLRMRACFAATAVAEYFRDQGADVLLLMDSVTRMAMAGRQIGLAAGEPPATKGYPPSVFAAMPRVMERCGRTNQGSITGLYTVLVEADDLNDPVADAARGILDGHIWLSRRLASRGQYPAVSVLDSISRVMPDVTDADQMAAAGRIRRLLAVWAEIEDLVSIGAYAAGSNPEYDLAIRMRPEIEKFLSQGIDDEATLEDSRAALLELARSAAAIEASQQNPQAKQAAPFTAAASPKSSAATAKVSAASPKRSVRS